MRGIGMQSFQSCYSTLPTSLLVPHCPSSLRKPHARCAWGPYLILAEREEPFRGSIPSESAYSFFYMLFFLLRASCRVQCAACVGASRSPTSVAAIRNRKMCFSCGRESRKVHITAHDTRAAIVASESLQLCGNTWYGGLRRVVPFCSAKKGSKGVRQQQDSQGPMKPGTSTSPKREVQLV